MMCPVGKGRQVGWPIDSLARRAGVGSMPSHRCVIDELYSKRARPDICHLS